MSAEDKEKLILGQMSDRSNVADIVTNRLLDKKRPKDSWVRDGKAVRTGFDSMERLRQRKRYARKLKLKQGKAADWEWMEKRAKGRRTRQRRKYRRNKIKAREEKRLAAKAMGREPSDSGTSSDGRAPCTWCCVKGLPPACPGGPS